MQPEIGSVQGARGRPNVPCGRPKSGYEIPSLSPRPAGPSGLRLFV